MDPGHSAAVEPRRLALRNRLTNDKWVLIEPLLPEPHDRERPRRWPALEILNGMFYVLRGGIAWRLLPSDLPPKSIVFRWFSLWRDTGLLETINHLLVMADRERVGQEAPPTAAVLASQSLKTTESGGPRGSDAGKKVKGRKRQVMVDTGGCGLILEPQPADVQDWDGAWVVLRLLRRALPFIATAVADSGYAGGTPASWISRNRRLWKDPEATLTSARAFLYAASVMLLVRHLGRRS